MVQVPNLLSNNVYIDKISSTIILAYITILFKMFFVLFIRFKIFFIFNGYVRICYCCYFLIEIDSNSEYFKVTTLRYNYVFYILDGFLFVTQVFVLVYKSLRNKQCFDYNVREKLFTTTS